MLSFLFFSHYGLFLFLFYLSYFSFCLVFHSVLIIFHFFYVSFFLMNIHCFPFSACLFTVSFFWWFVISVYTHVLSISASSLCFALPFVALSSARSLSLYLFMCLCSLFLCLTPSLSLHLSLLYPLSFLSPMCHISHVSLTFFPCSLCISISFHNVPHRHLQFLYSFCIGEFFGILPAIYISLCAPNRKQSQTNIFWASQTRV